MTLDRLSTSQSQSWGDRQALPVENSLPKTSRVNADGPNDWDQPPGLSGDTSSSEPEESVTPKLARSVIGDHKSFNHLLHEKVNAEAEPDPDGDQGHTKTQRVDSAEDNRQDIRPEVGGVLGFSGKAVSVTQQEGDFLIPHFLLS